MSFDSRIAGFMKMNAAFYLAQAHSLHIGSEWSVSTERKVEFSDERIFKAAIEFLRKNQLSLLNGLTQTQVEIFSANLIAFAQKSDYQKSAQKLSRIRDLLQFGSTEKDELKKALSSKSLNPTQKQLLEQALCCFDFQRYLIPKIQLLLSHEKEYCEYLLKAISQKVNVVPSFAGTSVSWTARLFTPLLNQPCGSLLPYLENPDQLMKELDEHCEKKGIAFEADHVSTAIKLAQMHTECGKSRTALCKNTQGGMDLVHSWGRESKGYPSLVPSLKRAVDQYYNLVEINRLIEGKVLKNAVKIAEKPHRAEPFIRQQLENINRGLHDLDLCVAQYRAQLEKISSIYRAAYAKLSRNGRRVKVNNHLFLKQMFIPKPEVFAQSSTS